MNSLSGAELKSFVQDISGAIRGAQLQDIWLHNEVLFLEFYLKNSFWLAIDLKLVAPQLNMLLEKPPPMNKEKKPLVLFLQSHAKNLRIQELSVLDRLGRVVVLDLGACVLQVILIPHAANILVQAGDKKIAWAKPKDLKEQSGEDRSLAKIDWQERTQKWLQDKFRTSKKTNEESDGAQKTQKALEKKRKAVLALQEQLQKDPAVQWRLLGEALKASAEIPAELSKLLDSKKSKSWNIENSFAKAKQLERKVLGTRERLEILQKEIQELETRLQNPAMVKAQAPSSAAQIMRKFEVQGRKLDLGDGIEAVMGKSGEDNLSLLRHSRAWDLWVHLKDYPGAYAILIRQKNQSVGDAQIKQVSQWLIQQFLSKKSVVAGGKYDILVTECRFVRPVKGAKKGLVTYQNARTLTVAAKLG